MLGSGEPIGLLDEGMSDVVALVHYGDDTPYPDGQRGFPPSGVIFYRGEPFVLWDRQLLMGSLRDRFFGTL